jgi:hypothetical protein
MSPLKRLARWVLREEIAAARFEYEQWRADSKRRREDREVLIQCLRENLDGANAMTRAQRRHIANLKTERRIRAPKLP